MTNLFSSFDPNTRVLIINLPFNWISASICIFFIPQIYWLVDSQLVKTVKKIIIFVYEELRAVFGLFVLPGTIFIFISLFFFYFIFKLLGPYTLYFY